MELNAKYVHAHFPDEYHFVPTEYTSKGVKGQQTTYYPGRRKKPKVATVFFQSADYGLWVRTT